MRCLRDSQAVVRFRSAVALGNLGYDARAAVPEIAALLRDVRGISSGGPSWELRKAAAFALGVTAGHRDTAGDRRAFEALAQYGFRDSCALVRLESVIAIVKLGIPADHADRQVVGHSLLPLLKDKDKRVALWTQVALIIIDQPSEDRIKAIGGYLRDPDMDVRSEAAHALETLGDKARSRVSDLIGALRDKEPAVANMAASALSKMTAAVSNAHLQEIAGMLNDDKVQVRANAAAALGTLAPIAQKQIPALIGALEGKDPDAVVPAIWALTAFGQNANSAIPVLTRLTQDKDVNVKVAAAQAIDRIAKAEKPKSETPTP
jgi:HEAT repeat protein